MSRSIVWVHGIGNHQAGYSAAWEANFDRYLNLGHQSYVEVVWETVFDAARRRARGRAAEPGIELTRQEQLAEAELRQALEAILIARASAFAEARAMSGERRRAERVVEWSQLKRAARRQRGIGNWLLQPDEYLGDFTRYLVSGSVRSAVKEKAKEQLRPWAGSDVAVSVIAHSWGTVVAYDTLLDLEAEQPTLTVANLMTLGSPLWLVRQFLEDSSGRKPGQLSTWMNIHARGDLIGAWLGPAFRVDRDYEVPSVGESEPHGSYFTAENEYVQRELVAAAILG